MWPRGPAPGLPGAGLRWLRCKEGRQPWGLGKQAGPGGRERSGGIVSVRESEALRERVDAVQEQAAELKQAVDKLRQESSEQVKARIQQVKADIAGHHDFRVPGLPFSPHPHVGFAAVTNVFEDSSGGVRNRASTGADLVLGPGAIVWTYAGSGIVQEEIPAEPGVELHGVQIFDNLSATGMLTRPEVHNLVMDSSAARPPQPSGEPGRARR